MQERDSVESPNDRLLQLMQDANSDERYVLEQVAKLISDSCNGNHSTSICFSVQSYCSLYEYPVIILNLCKNIFYSYGKIIVKASVEHGLLQITIIFQSSYTDPHSPSTICPNCHRFLLIDVLASADSGREVFSACDCAQNNNLRHKANKQGP